MESSREQESRVLVAEVARVHELSKKMDGSLGFLL